MRRKAIWGIVVAVLVATPAVLGLVLVRGDDSSSRRAAALVAVGTGAGYELVVSGLTPSGEAAEVLAYSWGASSNATFGAGGFTTGRAQFEALQITKKVDIASPNFGKAVAMGTHYPSATLTLYSGGSEGTKPNAYMIYKMTDVLITSVQHGGSANDLPTEQISLNYAKLEVTHKELAEGTVKRQTLFTYDLAAAKAS
jgi:type VI secretion system secreted protein Hcp